MGQFYSERVPFCTNTNPIGRLFGHHLQKMSNMDENCTAERSFASHTNLTIIDYNELAKLE